ncbi:MAG: hypothetical protein V3T81_00570 [Thermoanaerobaculia bacterium]
MIGSQESRPSCRWAWGVLFVTLGLFTGMALGEHPPGKDREGERPSVEAGSGAALDRSPSWTSADRVARRERSDRRRDTHS